MRLDRRFVLRGAGVSLALPLLDAMISPANANTNYKRLQVLYMPNGMMMPNFTPKDVGDDYTISPILKPLEPYKKKFMVISGLDHVQAEALGDGAGDHGRCCGSYLTGMHVKKTEGADLSNGISLDQIVANKFSDQTEFRSLELGVEPPSLVGSCDSGYSCAYTNTLSWMSSSIPLPVTINPRDAFERLFGDGDDTSYKSRIERLKKQKSILDFVLADAKKMSSILGREDKKKIQEYMESVRYLEISIQKAENTNYNNLPTFARPSGVPDTFEEHVKMMIDVQVLAMQTDKTRVGTFMLGREVSGRSYPEIGVADAHHPLSHHGNDPEKIAKLTKINTLHMEQVAYYLKRMDETMEGEKSLLDNTLVIAGASLADPNVHSHRNLPTIVAGGLIKGNRHLVAEKGTPMTNMMMSVLDTLDIKHDKLGDSTGRLSGFVG